MAIELSDVFQEADVAFAPLTITSARERVVDFTRAYMTYGISLMVHKDVMRPDSRFNKPGILSMFDPLSSEVGLLKLL